jgi:hypothetical protein
MNFKVTYCSTPDGMGKDIAKEIKSEDLCHFSELPYGDIKIHSIHKQDNNLIQCVCDYLNIEQIQIICIEVVNVISLNKNREN